MVNVDKVDNKKVLKHNNFGSAKNSQDYSPNNSKLSGFGLHKLTPRSIDFDPFMYYPPTR